MKLSRHFLSLQVYIMLTVISLLSCRPSKNNQTALVGNWITVDKDHMPSIVVTAKKYRLILDSGEPRDIDTFNFTYKLKRNLLTITQGSYWISKNRIIKLTDDSLVIRRRGDKQVFRFSRKK